MKTSWKYGKVIEFCHCGKVGTLCTMKLVFKIWTYLLFTFTLATAVTYYCQQRTSWLFELRTFPVVCSNVSSTFRMRPATTWCPLLWGDYTCILLLVRKTRLWTIYMNWIGWLRYTGTLHLVLVERVVRLRSSEEFCESQLEPAAWFQNNL